MPDDQPPETEPTERPTLGRRVLLNLTSLATCLVMLVVFGIGSVGSPVESFGMCLVIVLALFALRARGNRSPLLGAAATGSAAALILVGACIAIVRSLRP